MKVKGRENVFSIYVVIKDNVYNNVYYSIYYFRRNRSIGYNRKENDVIMISMTFRRIRTGRNGGIVIPVCAYEGTKKVVYKSVVEVVSY